MRTTTYKVGVNNGTRKSNLEVRIDKNEREFVHRIIKELVENNGYKWLNCSVHVLHYPERGRGLIKSRARQSMGAYG